MKDCQKRNGRRVVCMVLFQRNMTFPRARQTKGKSPVGLTELSDDAAFNFESYADCFISENLVRKYIKKEKLPLSTEAKGRR